ASQVTAAGGTAPEEAASAVTTSEEKAESTEASSDNRNAESDEYAELAAIGDVQVENGIMTVSITLPPEFAEGITQEQLDASNGTIYESAVLNEDGSVTYKMTRAQHKAVMEQLSDSFDESIQEMIDNNEYYSISAVTHNDDFTVFDVTLNGTELGFQDAYSAYAFYMYGGMYGIFNGHTPEHVIVNYRDPDGNLIEQGDSANMGDAEESPDTSDPSQDSESGTDNSANTGTFERTVLIDNDECSIVVKDINEKDFWGYTLKVELENKSPDKTFMFSVDDAYVNGVEADPLFATEVNAGKKANSEISFSSSELKKHGIDDFTDIEIMFRVYDTDTYEYVAAEETVHVYPHGEENAVMFSRETADTDTILADDDNVTIIVTGYTEKDEFGYYNVNLFFVNKTDTTVMFSVQDASVNGYMADPFFAIEIAPGKCAFRSMSWSDTVFEENGIEEVEEIVAHFVAYDSDNYERDYLDEEFTLNP
ncbi:MAG: hypothetical protein Q4D81_13735, partial [Eubacteriales bacterium]|nr:hypothetical protein [Eubacteriales bacterium]